MKTKEKKNYYRLGERGDSKEDDGRDHIIITKGTNYK
jgi:hypothetical protein